MIPPDFASRLAQAGELLRAYPPGTLDIAENYFRGPSRGTLDPLVVAILAYHLPPQLPDASPITLRPPSTDLVADLGFDSLAFVEMGFLLQDLLGVRLADGELREIRTLGDLQAVIARHAGVS